MHMVSIAGNSNHLPCNLQTELLSNNRILQTELLCNYYGNLLLCSEIAHMHIYIFFCFFFKVIEKSNYAQVQRRERNTVMIR